MIPPSQMQFVCDLMRTRTAILIDNEKQYLVESRLAPIARAARVTSVGDLLRRLQSTRDKQLEREVAEALMTNETSFFRDQHPFEAVRSSIVPALMERRRSNRAIRIWCGAASSGQEPYSIAMTLAERFPELKSWSVRILATDLSMEMLERCRAGRYSQLEVNRGVPPALRERYFRRDGASWLIAPELRRMIEFRQLNLAQPWSSMPRVDVVFLRNVLIYFDVAMKKSILGRVRGVMQPDGYLFLGGAETTINLDEAYEWVPYARGGCYRLRGRPKGS